ncbi:hypothetical protein LR48_Vigan10g252200 [Vigna angularis]|uniref:Uncharacterized protein n=1 Tax=Phaseolus angularis TaxID=3914 RepID=A0A0L9VNI9_PHAAN|nr:hypothetical protein LR48_Vigan10g252200 [Vigna angularis]
MLPHTKRATDDAEAELNGEVDGMGLESTICLAISRVGVYHATDKFAVGELAHVIGTELLAESSVRPGRDLATAPTRLKMPPKMSGTLASPQLLSFALLKLLSLVHFHHRRGEPPFEAFDVCNRSTRLLAWSAEVLWWPVLRLYRSIAVVVRPSIVVIFLNRRQSPSTSLPSPPSSLLSTPLIPSSVAVCWRPEFRRSFAGFPCCPIPRGATHPVRLLYKLRLRVWFDTKAIVNINGILRETSAAGVRAHQTRVFVRGRSGNTGNATENERPFTLHDRTRWFILILLGGFYVFATLESRELSVPLCARNGLASNILIEKKKGMWMRMRPCVIFIPERSWICSNKNLRIYLVNTSSPMDNVVDSLNNAYQDFVSAAANVLEVKENAGFVKTTATDTALENFKQNRHHSRPSQPLLSPPLFAAIVANFATASRHCRRRRHCRPPSQFRRVTCGSGPSLRATANHAGFESQFSVTRRYAALLSGHSVVGRRPPSQFRPVTSKSGASPRATANPAGNKTRLLSTRLHAPPLSIRSRARGYHAPASRCQNQIAPLRVV